MLCSGLMLRLPRVAAPPKLAGPMPPGRLSIRVPPRIAPRTPAIVTTAPRLSSSKLATSCLGQRPGLPAERVGVLRLGQRGLGVVLRAPDRLLEVPLRLRQPGPGARSDAAAPGRDEVSRPRSPSCEPPASPGPAPHALARAWPAPRGHSQARDPAQSLPAGRPAARRARRTARPPAWPARQRRPPAPRPRGAPPRPARRRQARAVASSISASTSRRAAASPEAA